MKTQCLSLECSECCKRYRVPVLPSEAKEIAKKTLLGMEGLAGKCTLVAALYRTGSPRPLSINSFLLPKKTLAKTQAFFGQMPGQFLALPYLALGKKKNGECNFLEKGKCTIHGFAPHACRLFPFISTNTQNAREAYPFCKALAQKGSEKMKTRLDKKELGKTTHYFNAVEKKGFLSQYPVLPKKALILLEGTEEIPVSKKEFLETIQPLI